MSAIVERSNEERLVVKIIATNAPPSKEKIQQELSVAVSEMAEVLSILGLSKGYTTKFQSSKSTTGIRSILLALLPRLQAAKNSVDHADMSLARI